MRAFCHLHRIVTVFHISAFYLAKHTTGNSIMALVWRTLMPILIIHICGTSSITALQYIRVFNIGRHRTNKNRITITILIIVGNFTILNSNVFQATICNIAKEPHIMHISSAYSQIVNYVMSTVKIATKSVTGITYRGPLLAVKINIGSHFEVFTAVCSSGIYLLCQIRQLLRRFNYIWR